MGCVLAAMLGGVAVAAPVTFIKIADTTTGFTTFNDAPSLNNNGTVAFRATPFEGLAGIFVGSGGPATAAVANSPGSGPPGLNDSGTVSYSDTTGVHKATAGVVTNIALTSGPLNGFGFTRINSAGTVSFVAGIDAGGAGWFTGSGGAVTTIADTSGPLGGTVNNAPSINSSGTVAFQCFLDAGGEGLFAGNGGALTTIAQTGGTYVQFVNLPSINDAGVASFSATLANGSNAVLRNTAGVIGTVADNSGPYKTFGGTTINSSGAVAFFASLDAGGSGFFTGPDPINDRLIATGDSLFGSTVSTLNGSAWNDGREFAFRYTLANGTTGIAVAVAPEPGALSLLLPVGIAALRRGRRNRQR